MLQISRRVPPALDGPDLGAADGAAVEAPAAIDVAAGDEETHAHRNKLPERGLHVDSHHARPTFLMHLVKPWDIVHTKTVGGVAVNPEDFRLGAQPDSTAAFQPIVPFALLNVV